MNVQKRASSVYIFLYLTALWVWYIQQPSLLWLTISALVLIALSYVIPLHFNHGLFIQGGFALVLFLFNFLIVYSGTPSYYFAFFDTRVIYPLTTTLVILFVYYWYKQPSIHFDWLLFMSGALFLLSTLSNQITTLSNRRMYLLIAALFVLTLVIYQVFFRIKQRGSFKWESMPPLNYFIHIGISLICLIFLSQLYIRLTVMLDGQIFKIINDNFISGKKLSWSGFSGTTILRSNMEINLSNNVVMTVKTPYMLDHLRGNVLTTYKQGRWFPQEDVQPVATHNDFLPINFDVNEVHPPYIVKYEGHAKKIEWKAEFNYMGFYDGRIFSPNSARFAGATQKEFVINKYNLIKQKKFIDFPTYTLFGVRQTDLPVTQNIQSLLKENLQIPEEVKKELKPLAMQLTQGAKTHVEKAKKIQAWFHQNFTYSLKTTQIPTGKDPVVDFVLNKKPAFCSWFASGMSLLLRSIDIPAHVTSGWYDMEYNRLNDLWLIREKDAHDWVEVLSDDQTAWLTFDPTPANQLMELTGGNKPSIWTQMKDALMLNFKWFGQYFIKTSLTEKLTGIKNLAIAIFKSPWTYISFLFLIVLNIYLKRKQSKKQVKRQKKHLITEVQYGVKEDLESSLEPLLKYLNDRGLKPEGAMTWNEILAQIKLNDQFDYPLAEKLFSHLQFLRYGTEDAEKEAIGELNRQITEFVGKG